MNIEETNEEVVEVTDESGAEVVDESQAEESGASDQELIEKTLIDTDQEEEEAEEGEEGKPEAEEKNEDEGQPKFEMPDLGEGVEFDTELFKSMTPVLEEMDASQEQVQKLAEAYLGHVEKAAKIHGDQMIEKYNEIKDTWKKEAQTELKGSIKQDLMNTGIAVKKFGSPALVELFNETGVGNHVEVVKMMSKIGKLFAEDDLVDGEKGDGDGNPEDVLYPTMKE